MANRHLPSQRSGAAHPVLVLGLVSLGLLLVLSLVLVRDSRQRSAGTADGSTELVVYCAAAMRGPLEEIAKAYQGEVGTPVRLVYGGSNTLVSQIEVSQRGDLFVAADESYTELARSKNLIKEVLPVAAMRPVIVVAQGNPKQIKRLDDLVRDDVRLALGNPDQAAIGKVSKQLLEAAGLWPQVEERVRAAGVFKPTVPDVANDVKIGSVDAGIVWDTTAAQYADLDMVHAAPLDEKVSRVELGVLTVSKDPAAALRFAQYVTASDRGLETFAKYKFETVEGKPWTDAAPAPSN
jgi:molybdate transport system substrate-binding protein